MPDDEKAAVFYFASNHSSSHAGQIMAKAVADELGLPISGRSIPMLKNTRSPAIVIASPKMGAYAGGLAAQGVINLFAGKGE